MNRDFHDFHRGEIFYADLDPVSGNMQGGYRPVVIVQNDVGNFFSPTVQIVPATSNCLKKPHLPTHVLLEDIDGLRPSIFMAEQSRPVNKSRMGKYVGKLTSEQMNLIDDALRVNLGLTSPEDWLPTEVEAP